MSSPAPAPDSMAREVTTVLRRLVRGTAPSLDQVAESLGMSGRTLRRRLQSEGAAFQPLLDAVRLELAEQSIAARTMSLAELSSFLGFSAQSAFKRAFRRWTGTTPRAYARRRSA